MGTVYIFKTSDNGSSWEQVKKLTANDYETVSQFGAIDINDKYIIVGADIHNNVNSVNLSKSGAAYIFKIPESGNKQKLKDSRAIVGSYGKLALWTSLLFYR